MLNKATLTFGADIESIVTTLTGEPFPICGIVGGTKDKPRNIGGGYFIQEDNVLLEWNIPVTKDRDDFVDAVTGVYDRLKKELPPSLQMDFTKCTAQYAMAYLQGIPEAQRFGCEPDYNAWTEEQNPRPQANDPTLRSAAGHIHIGWEKPDPEDQLELIRWADVFVSLPSVWESHDRSRRQLYGKAGSFRPKEYGVEHRVLDNYWAFNMNVCRAIYERYLKAATTTAQGLKVPTQYYEKIQKTINDYNVSAAQQLYKELTSYVQTAN